jgi:2'-5' RNA ligase
MRLFVAIDLDDRAKQAIAAEQKRIASVVKAAERGLRWVRPEQMHVTLVFLGDVDERRADMISETVHEPVPIAPFAIVFGGLGMFPERGAPRALWTALTAGASETIAVQRIMVERLERIGVPREARPFRPHLTIGRWRESRPADRHHVIAADRGATIARVDVASVTLYRSQLSAAAPVYTPLAIAPLRS